MIKDLIFDLGFHIGQDTEFYLKKGFRVVAIDANPILIEEGKAKFAKAIAERRLVLINVGIGEKTETLSFYVNKTHSEWSSFDPKIGATRGEYYLIDVPVVTLESIIGDFGVPYYLKVDIEGHDFIAIKSLRGQGKPQYVSIENGHDFMIDELYQQGYSKFKFINQKYVRDIRLTPPAKEGVYVDHVFVPGASGPFGEELPGEWLSKEAVTKLSNDYWQNPQRNDSIHGWYDLHASL